MATVQEAIRRLKIESTSSGVTETTDKLKSLAKAQGDVAVASERTEKATQSAESRLNSIQRRYDQAYRSQTELAKVERDLGTARAQGLISQARQAELLGLATTQLNQHSKAQQALSTITQDLQGRAASASASLGSVGQALAVLGPAGLGVAAGVGAAIIAIKEMSDAAHGLAQKSQELRGFAEATGLSTTQVQALRAEASKFGVTSDEVQASIQQFTARFNELRLGQGELLTQVRRVNPALALQMQSATDAGEAMTMFGRALQQVDNIFERNALVKAAAGRGGLRTANFFAGLDVGAVTQSYEAAGKALDENLIRKLAQLEIDITKTSGKARDNISKIFAQDVLQGELAFYQGLLSITKVVNDFNLTPDFRALINFALNPLMGAGIGSYIGTLAGRGAKSLMNRGSPETAEWPVAGPAPYQNQGPMPPAGFLTPQAQLANLKATADAMGEAATYSQKLTIAQQQLAIAGREAGLTEAQLGKSLSVLNASSALQVLQARVGLLGDLASAEEVELSMTMRINLERAKGITISKEEEIRLRERARLQQEYSKLPNQLAFERDQLGRDDINATVASRLRGANLPIDLESSTAHLIRMNEQLRTAKDLAGEFASGFVRDLRQGVPALEALTSALNRLADRLIDMALNKAISGLFGNILGAIGGTSYGGGGAGDQGPTLAMVGRAHSGGVVGSLSASHYVHPAYFDDAQRYHAGGIIGQRERGIIALDDEEVLTRSDPRHRWNGGMAGGGSSVVLVKPVIINNAGVDVSIGQPKSDGAGGVSLEIMLDQATAKSLSKPGSQSNSFMRSGFGVRNALSRVTQ